MLRVRINRRIWPSLSSFSTRLLVIFSFVVGGFFACSGQTPERLNDWEIQSGDAVGKAGGWKPIHLPLSIPDNPELETYKGYLTLRSPVKVIHNSEAKVLAIDSGWLSDVSQFYLNDKSIGGIGTESPYVTGSGMYYIQSLPQTAVVKPGDFIYLRLFMNGNYPPKISQVPVIGPADAVFREYHARELIALVLLGVYGVVGLGHILLGIRRPQETYNLFFGIGCLILSLYWLLRMPGRDFVFGHNVLLRQHLEYSVLYFVPPILMAFLSHFFYRKFHILTYLGGAVAILAALLTFIGDYWFSAKVLTIWQMTAFPAQLLYGVFYIVREVKRKSQEAIWLVAGVVLLIFAAFHDIASTRGLVPTPQIAQFTFLIFILGIAWILANRFVRVHTDMEALNSSLENIVRLFQRRFMGSDSKPLPELANEILSTLDTLIPFEKGFIITIDRLNNVEMSAKGQPPPILQGDRWQSFLARFARKLSLSEEFVDEMDHLHDLMRGLRDLPFLDKSDFQAKYPILIELYTNVIKGVQADNFEVMTPLIYRKEIWGFLALGSRQNAASYSPRDLKLLDLLRLFVALAGRNKSYAEDIEGLKESAEAEVSHLTDFIYKKEIVTKSLEDRTIVYASPGMQKVMDSVSGASVSNRAVLITGETGTGKELIAHLIAESKGKKQPFVAINCGAIPAALWEDEIFGHVGGAFTDAKSSRSGRVADAGTGTCFLDEVGEIPLEMQSKLLRVLQEGTYLPVGGRQESVARCRFVFATNRNLEQMVSQGLFREDLYYRINVFTIHIPPLRDRKEDIPAIVEHLLPKFCEELSIGRRELSGEAMFAFTQYSWPGNVRELENVLIRVMTASKESTIGITDLPLSLSLKLPRKPGAPRWSDPAEDEIGDFDAKVNGYRRRLIESALKKAGGNKTEAARLLGIGRNKLRYQLAELEGKGD
ncbi:MAG: sigma-54 dependent transcriptional regulator [Spirochaetia bacterium]|nr:sigma-54 dependent transcriptional regulator [Spirochaetia bacterium]